MHFKTRQLGIVQIITRKFGEKVAYDGEPAFLLAETTIRDARAS
jgi:hypothetical protein